MTSSSSNIESNNLALDPGRKLWVSLYSNVPRAQDLVADVRAHTNLAIIDAARIVSLSQLVVAANTAVARNKHSNSLAWDTVMAAAASTHAGHVMRDYAFGEDSEPQEHATVLALAVGGTLNDYKKDLARVGLEDPQPIGLYFAKQRTPEQIADFYRWYKITHEEVAISSLEQAVLTRISTKFYV